MSFFWNYPPAGDSYNDIGCNGTETTHNDGKRINGLIDNITMLLLEVFQNGSTSKNEYIWGTDCMIEYNTNCPLITVLLLI